MLQLARAETAANVEAAWSTSLAGPRRRRILHMKTGGQRAGGLWFYREQLSGLAVVKIYTRYLAPARAKSPLTGGGRSGKNEDSIVLFHGKRPWEVTFAAPARDDLATPTTRDSTLPKHLYILRQRPG